MGVVTEMRVTQISKLVMRLKGRGFWRSETERELRLVDQELRDNGFAPDESCELISKVWTAAVGEYGE